MSQKNFMSYGDAETLFTEVGQELSDKVPKSQLTANNTDFRFGYDENTGKYGYILNEGGADTVIPFKDCDSSEITVSAANQILSGYKDYDSNGNIITGTNAGYDAGVTQGEANMKDGVTLDYDGNHLLQGYKARTSAGVLITGTNKGYDAGVTQGHSDRDSGVTVTAASQLLSGYKARTSSGTLVTGSDAGYTSGYNAGVTQGHSDRDSGVTVTAANQIVSGYKARNSSGTLLTGNAVAAASLTVKNNTPKTRNNSTNPSNATQSASMTAGQIAILSGYSYGGSGKGSVTFSTSNTTTISEQSASDGENLAKTRVVRATASATITVTVIAGAADGSKQGASSSIVIMG